MVEGQAVAVDPALRAEYKEVCREYAMEWAAAPAED